MSDVNIALKKPEWLKVKAPNSSSFYHLHDLLRLQNLNTVCQEAACPNIGECWAKGHATFMILGSVCTRACRFCNVETGIPDKLDPHEPEKLAATIKKMNLLHAVITSVDRDDLQDGGASHFAKCIQQIKLLNPETTIEVLTPDFLRKQGAIEIVVAASPDIYNHNIETVPSLYAHIRPGSRYFNSLNLLWKVKQLNKNLFTKSGIMVGLGETDIEIAQVMDDLRAAGVDLITIGQYLQPTINHAPVMRYATPQEFEKYGALAKIKGFKAVASGPLVRSSYNAGEYLRELIISREAKAQNIENA